MQEQAEELLEAERVIRRLQALEHELFLGFKLAVIIWAALLFGLTWLQFRYLPERFAPTTAVFGFISSAYFLVYCLGNLAARKKIAAQTYRYMGLLDKDSGEPQCRSRFVLHRCLSMFSGSRIEETLARLREKIKIKVNE